MTMEYYKKLQNYINSFSSDDDFKELYKEYFNKEPDQKLVNIYLSNCRANNNYENELPSYDD